MISMTYRGEKGSYDVEFSNVNQNVIQMLGEFPVKVKGFFLSRKGKKDGWDYTDYTTIYRKIDGGVQFSCDGSVYVAPVPEPEPTPAPEPTVEELQEAKVAEMNAAQQSIIQRGVDVILTSGQMEHFTLTDHDQTSLTGLKAQVLSGAENIPWHTSDESEHCKFYSNEDMKLITDAAMKCVTWNVTYFRDLRIYIRSLKEKDDIEAITYGMDIPDKYQSEPLKAMLMERNGGV